MSLGSPDGSVEQRQGTHFAYLAAFNLMNSSKPALVQTEGPSLALLGTEVKASGRKPGNIVYLSALKAYLSDLGLGKVTIDDHPVAIFEEGVEEADRSSPVRSLVFPANGDSYRAIERFIVRSRRPDISWVYLNRGTIPRLSHPGFHGALTYTKIRYAATNILEASGLPMEPIGLYKYKS